MKKPSKKALKKKKSPVIKKRKRISKKRQKEIIAKAQATARINREKKQRELMRALRVKYLEERKKRREKQRALMAPKYYTQKKPRILQKKKSKQKLEQEIFEPTADVETPQFLVANVTKKLEAMAERIRFEENMAFDSKIKGSVLSDLSVAIEADFSNVEDMDLLLAFMSEEIQHLGPMYKVSIIPEFDPSEIVKPYKMVDGQIEMNDKRYDMYKGNMAIPTNVTRDIPGAFVRARVIMLRDLLELTGVIPTKLRVVLFAGESVLAARVPRKLAITKLKLFD